jgi:hypothetical protein
MPTVTVLNTDSNLNARTLLTAEGTATITALHTFDRDPNAPFGVSAGSAVVANLDADKVDGYEASALAVLAENETVTGNWTISGATTLSNVTTLTVSGATAITTTAGADILRSGAGFMLNFKEGATLRGGFFQENSALGLEFTLEASGDMPAPGANGCRIYTKDSGGGKTQLIARFNSGAVQVIATEP